MKVVFFGSSKFVIPIIEVLQKNFDLALVITTEKSPSDPVPFYCYKNTIPYFSVSDLSNAKANSQLSNVNCQLAVLADFGILIPKEILNAFPKGIINIHPSLLPKYRGPTPVQTAILNGEKETGISIIKLDSEIDHGPILAQEKVQILPQDTSQSLYERLFKKGGEILYNVLNKYLNGSLNPLAQNHKNATYTKHLTRQDGFINIDMPPSPGVLKRMINAYFPWPGVYAKLKINPSASSGEKLKIVKFLPEQKMQVEGKKPVSYKDFKNGYESVIPNSFRDLIEMLK